VLDLKHIQPSHFTRDSLLGGKRMENREDVNGEGVGKNQPQEEQSTLGFPIVDPDTMVQMKNIPPLVLPHFHGKVHEDPNDFLSEFDILCRSYDYSLDVQNLKLFPTTLKDSALCWFMGLRGVAPILSQVQGSSGTIFFQIQDHQTTISYIIVNPISVNCNVNDASVTV